MCICWSALYHWTKPRLESQCPVRPKLDQGPTGLQKRCFENLGQHARHKGGSHLCNVRAYHSGFVVCDAVPLGAYFQTFRRTVTPSSSRVKQPAREDKVLYGLKTCYTPDDFSKYSRVSFYDDSLLRPLPSRTEHFRLVVHHCRNSSVLSLLSALLYLFRCVCFFFFYFSAVPLSFKLYSFFMSSRFTTIGFKPNIRERNTVVKRDPTVL